MPQLGSWMLGVNQLGERDTVFEAAPPAQHAPYEVQVRDPSRALLARLEQPLSWSYSRRLMEAGELRVVLPREGQDEKLTTLRLTSFIEIWDALQGRCSCTRAASSNVSNNVSNPANFTYAATTLFVTGWSHRGTPS